MWWLGLDLASGIPSGFALGKAKVYIWPYISCLVLIPIQYNCPRQTYYCIIGDFVCHMAIKVSKLGSIKKNCAHILYFIRVFLQKNIFLQLLMNLRFYHFHLHWQINHYILIDKGCLPERFCTKRFPLSSITGPPPITELVQYWDWLRSNQRQVGLELFCSLPEAILYTTTFSMNFQALEWRLSWLWLAGTNLRESLRSDNNTWRQSIKCK